MRAPGDPISKAHIMGNASPGVIPFLKSEFVQKRMYNELREASESDTRPDMTAKFDAVMCRVRWTLGQAIHEARQPEPDANPAAVQQMLCTVQNVAWLYRKVDDHLHDFHLTSTDHNMEYAERKFEESFRGQRGRDRGDLIGRLFHRFHDDFTALRRLERDLRSQLREPCGDYDYDSIRPEVIVDACFDAALSLEANYEDRVFEPHS